MRRKLLTTFILALSLGACGPAMEPASSPPNILNLEDNSGSDPGDLDQLFDSQETMTAEEEEEQNDTSGDTFGPDGQEPPLITDGPALDEVIPEPVTGPPPVDLAQEAQQSETQQPEPPVQQQQVEITEPTQDSDPIAEEEQPQDQTEQAQTNQEATASDENQGSAQVPESGEDRAEEAVQDETPVSTPAFSNPDAQKIYLQTVASSSIPFRRSEALKLFWGRFDAFMESRYQHTVTPEDREVFKIPRCSGTPEQPLQSMWPGYGPHFAMPPIVPVYVEQIDGVVDINAPLALLDREHINLNHGIDFPFPYYNILDHSSFRRRGEDPILDHFVDSRGYLAYLTLAVSKEVFQRAMFHASQMMTDSKASLDLAAECLVGSGPETLSCPEYKKAFEIHQTALRMQRLALAIASADPEGTCQSWVTTAAQPEERSECLFEENLNHDPEVWGVRTFYNPLRNLTRKSSDIDHWEKPERLSASEKDFLHSVLAQSVLAKPAADRWQELQQIRHQAMNVYKNITLLFPSLRFVRTAQMNEGDFAQALQKVRRELDGAELTYAGFKDLRLFPMTVLSRLEADAPVEMCDIAEEVVSAWRPSSVSGLLAADKSFHFIPLEFHRLIPLQSLSYNTFEGMGWQYIAETLYDFAETRAWAFLIASNDETIKVNSFEVVQAAAAALKAKGEEPADQTEAWLSSSPENLLLELLTTR